MALKPPPLRDPDLTGPTWQKWFRDLWKSASTLVGSPTVDNFASLDSAGQVQDSGYDATSFAAAVHAHNTLYYTETEIDALLVGSVLALLASATINGQTLTKQTVYTVPAGKTMIPHMVYIRSPSASLAGLTDMDIGGDANASDWIQQITLNAFTVATDYGVVTQPEQVAGPPIAPIKKTLYAAATAFGVKIITGSTGAATFKADLWGYLF